MFLSTHQIRTFFIKIRVLSLVGRSVTVSHLSKMVGAHQSGQSTYLSRGWSRPFPSASGGISLAWLCPAVTRSSCPGTTESCQSAAGSGCGKKFVQQLSRDRGARVQPALTKIVGFFSPFQVILGTFGCSWCFRCFGGFLSCYISDSCGFTCCSGNSRLFPSRPRCSSGCGENCFPVEQVPPWGSVPASELVLAAGGCVVPVGAGPGIAIMVAVLSVVPPLYGRSLE